jgi:signal transduction histidine kinase
MGSPAQDAVHVPQDQEPDRVPTSVWKTVPGAILIALLFTFLIFLVSSAADLLMLKEHETARITIELSDAVSSLAIGLLSFQLIRMHQERRAKLRKRVEVISDMNHHVRNALQVISLSTQGRDKEEIAAIRDSMNRIQWALRELLPKI